MTDTIIVDLVETPGAIVLETNEPSAVLSPVVPINVKHRLVWCETCGQITTQTLHDDAYQCDLCESWTEYQINDHKEGTAIDLKESDEARARFEAWCKELISR